MDQIMGKGVVGGTDWIVQQGGYHHNPPPLTSYLPIYKVEVLGGEGQVGGGQL